MRRSLLLWTVLSAAAFAQVDAGQVTKGTLPAGRLPAPTASTLGGVKGAGGSLTCAAGQVQNGLASDGSLACTNTRPTLDARDFGTPTGSNAGTLIQAAHDSAKCPPYGCVIDARGFGATDTIAGLSITKSGVNIILGATTFSVSATISHSIVNNTRFQGCGMGCTVLTWTGNNSTPMFDLNSVNDGVFSDFEILDTGAYPLSACFTAEQAATGVSNFNLLANVTCGSSGTITDGFHWKVGAGGDANNGSFTFTNVAFQGYTDACFNNDGSTQSQLNVLNQVKCRSYGYGNYGWYGQGSFSAHDTLMAGNKLCDYQVTYPNTGVTIDGAGFSISTNRFFCDSIASTIYPVTIQGQQMGVGASDGKTITIGGGGPYLIENNFVYSPNTVPAQFYYQPGGAPNARSIGNTIGSNLTVPLTCYGGLSTCWEEIGDTYTAGYQSSATAIPEILYGPLGIINGEIDFTGTNSNYGSLPIKATGYNNVLQIGAPLVTAGTKFTTSGGCSEGTLVGGASAGRFTTSGTTSCTTTITIGRYHGFGTMAPNGWQCSATDLTTLADAHSPYQTASTATGVTIASGTIVAGDVISFACTGY